MNFKDLKPCPVCGGVPWLRIQGQHGQFVEIECKDKKHHVLVNDTSEEKALKSWNDGIIRYRPVIEPVIRFVKE